MVKYMCIYKGFLSCTKKQNQQHKRKTQLSGVVRMCTWMYKSTSHEGKFN